MEIIYLNKKYTIKKLEEEQKKFQRALENPEFLIKKGLTDIFCFDPAYKIALDFFENIYNQFTAARFSLIMGHKKLHDSKYINWESGEEGQFWFRFMYLKNSIIWYNSSFELLWQAIWFGYRLYRNTEIDKKIIHEIDSSKTYENLLLRCTYNRLTSSLRKINEEQSNCLLNKIQNFHSCKEQKTIRGWANSLKHKGNLFIKELYFSGSGLKSGVFDSEFIKPKIIEIDLITETLKNYHINFNELLRYVYDFFDFKAMIPEGYNGKNEFRTRKEKEYKKIII
jgi:hypothetical protein